MAIVILQNDLLYSRGCILHNVHNMEIEYSTILVPVHVHC